MRGARAAIRQEIERLPHVLAAGGAIQLGGGGLPGGSISPRAATSAAVSEQVRRGFTTLLLRPNSYRWKLIGEREVLAPLNTAAGGYPQLRDRNFGRSGLSLASDRWDLRHAVVIEGEVRERVFYEDFPNLVLYVHDVPLDGRGWLDVMAADTGNPSQPVLYLARRGRMAIDRAARTIHMVLEEGTRHTTKLDDPAAYEVLKFDRTIIALDPESVFPRTGPQRGEREMAIEDLATLAADLEGTGRSSHRQVMEIHKKFSVPIACFVFAVLGLALGTSHRKDGKLAAFVLGIAVIFAYYVIMYIAEALAKGFWIPAWLTMWIPDLVLGAAGVFLLVRRARWADQPFRISLPSWLTRRAATTGAASAPVTATAGSPPTGAAALLIRVPHFSLPGPTLLDAYIARQYGRILAMTTVGMLGLFYISAFIDKSDKLFKGQISAGMLLEFLFWSTPEWLTYIIAIAVLLSGLVTVGLLTKNSELIVMRACGISLYRTALPMVVCRQRVVEGPVADRR